MKLPLRLWELILVDQERLVVLRLRLVAVTASFKLYRPTVVHLESGLLSGLIFFEVVQRNALAVSVAGLPEDRCGVLVGGNRLLKPSHLPKRPAEVGQRTVTGAGS